MRGLARREFLNTTLQGLGLALVGLVPGSFFFTRKALAQGGQVPFQPLAPADAARLKSVLAQTTTQNVMQVLRTSNLPPEDRLGILAVRQLSAGEIRHSLDRLKQIVSLGKLQECGTDCGSDCGGSCGHKCGGNCGGICGHVCDHGVAMATGSFCGGGCTVQAGITGVLDKTDTLGLDFSAMTLQRVWAATTEALRLVH
jgi:hypothetical protein